jgi:hypothetical protein
MTARRGAGLLALAIAGAALAACGPSPVEPKAQPGSTPVLHTPSATASTPPAPAGPESVAPLTGLAGELGGPAVVVPIQIFSGSANPAGLSRADIVSVEFAEGGAYRLVAVYQSRLDSSVGPVTMVRPSDAKVFAQVRPVFAETGSPSGFLDVVHAAGLSYEVAEDGRTGFTVRGGRVYADTGALSRGAAKTSFPPAAMFQYAAAGQPVSATGVSRASTMTVKIPGHDTVTWRWDATARQWRARVGGATAAATNVVAISVPYTTKEVSALKRTVSFANPLGTGKATIVAGPQSVRAVWTKNNFASGLNLLGPDQNVPYLMPGSTWILLMPSGSSVTIS